MTKLIFRYNSFYDYMLARLAGEEFLSSHETEGKNYLSNIEGFWEPLNDKVFSHYQELGFVLPEYWFAYPVHHWKNLTPFDDPLTFIIKENLEEVVATIIHEVCHNFFGYYENREICDKIWKNVETRFTEEDSDTKKHLIIIPLAASSLYKIFGQEKTEHLLNNEKKYEGLERAWQIIDQNKPDFKNPLKLIFDLRL
ncbi:MAG: hypothetical protein AAB585_00140 [Patescibacteria group bacterium]